MPVRACRSAAIRPSSGAFTFLSPRRLVSLEAYNGGTSATTLTVSCPGQSAATTIPAGQKTTIATGWTGVCTTVTISSTKGWNTNFDNLVHDDGTADSSAPAITAVSAQSVTDRAAAITWATDEAATSQVEYGSSTSYGSMTLVDANLVTGHSQTLAGLGPSTTYHYRVLSADATGNRSSSPSFTFTTADPNGLARTVGEWSPAMDWPLAAVRATLLYTGEILAWDAWERPDTPSGYLWNPRTQAFTNLPNR